MSPEHTGLRVAIFSPVPPAPSGIADYLADLLPLLPGGWDVELFAPETTGDSPDRTSRATYPVEGWAARDRERPFDLNLYQVGNALEQDAIIAQALEHPGLLVLHDAVLHPARVATRVATADLAGYRETAVAAAGSRGRALAHLVGAGLSSPAVYWRFPLCEDLVRASRLTVVHGKLLAAWLRAMVPDAAIDTVVHWRSVATAEPAAVAAWRSRLGAADRPLIGSFGHLGRAHGLDTLLEALQSLPENLEHAVALVGRADPALELEARLEAAGLDGRVHCTGALEDSEFAAIMHAVDIGVNLRYPTARASSGTLQQLMQLGVPVAVTDLLHLRDLPDAAVVRVPANDDGAKVLAAGLRRWLAEPVARARAGRSARRWAAAEITREGMAASYRRAVERAAAAPPSAKTTGSEG